MHEGGREGGRSLRESVLSVCGSALSVSVTSDAHPCLHVRVLKSVCSLPSSRAHVLHKRTNSVYASVCISLFIPLFLTVIAQRAAQGHELLECQGTCTQSAGCPQAAYECRGCVVGIPTAQRMCAHAGMHLSVFSYLSCACADTRACACMCLQASVNVRVEPRVCVLCAVLMVAFTRCRKRLLPLDRKRVNGAA